MCPKHDASLLAYYSRNQEIGSVNSARGREKGQVVLDKFPSLVAQIYDSLLGSDDAWRTFLCSLRDAVGGCQAALFIQGLAGAESRMISLGDPDYDRSYGQHYGAVNPWFTRGRHLIQPGAVVTSEWYPSLELKRSEFYADWLRPQGMFYAVNGFVFAGPRLAANVAVAKAWEKDGLETDDVSLFKRLMPHLQRVVSLQQRMAVHGGGNLSAQLDERMVSGLFVVDQCCTILRSNAVAQALVDKGDGLWLGCGGKLRAADPAQDRKLRNMIIAAVSTARTGAGEAGGYLPVTRGAGALPLALTISPLRAPILAFPGEPVAALVLVHEPESRARPVKEALMKLYGLTTREAEIAAALALGYDVDEIAIRIGRGRENVRTHLRHVMNKLDVHRQRELVRKLLLGCPLRDDEDD